LELEVANLEPREGNGDTEDIPDELRAAEAGRKGETLDTLGECLNILRHDGFAVDMEMATVAIHVYARRNLVCHAKVGSADIAHHRLLDKEISSA
jgi:hypothetical protein